MKVSIVIPNYNGRESLVENLPRVLTCGADEIIVIDDASTDGSVEEIERRYKDITVLRNKKNLGFSSTVDGGVEKASGDIIVLLNTDVSPRQDFLEPLITHFSDLKVFAVGCLDESPEDNKIILRGRGVGVWQRGFLVHQRGEVDKTDTLWVSGGSGAFRKDLWQKLGGFDPLYNPFYWEDIDLSYRALKAGYKTLFDPKSQVVHKHEEGIIKQNFSPFYINIITYRNQFFFVWKNIRDGNLILSHFCWLPYHLIKALFSFDWAFWLGFILAIIKLPQVISSRWKIRKLFVKSDKEIFSEFSHA